MSLSQHTPAPDFTLPSAAGENITLSTFNGTPLLLNFFTSHCVWCHTEMQRLAEIYRRVHNVNVRIIGIMPGSDTATTALQFAGEHRLDFPILLDNERSVCTSYGITRVPSVVLIDNEGKIARVYEGATEQLSGIVEQTILAAAGDRELPKYSLVGNGCAPE